MNRDSGPYSFTLVAQRKEQWVSTPRVAGSNPAGRT
jgi:hypothetical protein